MKKKIVKSSVIVAFVAAILSIALSTMIYFNTFENTMFTQSKTQVSLLVELLEGLHDEEIIDKLNEAKFDIDARITYIDITGNVLYDTDFDAQTMDNHIDRQEVKDAINSNFGQSQRYSDTANKTIYYSAFHIEGEGIIRVGVYAQDLFTTLIGDNILVMILFIAMILAVCYFISDKTTKRVVDVVTGFDVETGKGEIYEELSSFILKINTQNSIINNQIEYIALERDKLQNVFLNIQEGIVVCDRDGIIEQINNESKTVFNIKDINVHFSNQIRNPELQKAMTLALEGKRQEGIMQYQSKYYQYTIGPNIKDGYIQGAILITLDITVQMQNQNTRKQFADNVTHELKTPLTSILGYAQLINQGMAKKDDILPFAQIIEQNAQRLLEMIDDIIKLSAIEDGKLMNLEDVDVKKVLCNVIDEFTLAAKNKNIKISFKACEAVIKADEGYLYDITRNLISNAVKYNKEKGEVSIALTEDEKTVTVLISDTGIGIAQKDIDKIFERFYVSDTSRNKNISSSGLGLSIVKHALEAINGKITVTSSENEGTTFKIEFIK